LKPEIIIGGDTEGHHNEKTKDRQYRDLSTVMVMPTRGTIPARVCEALMGLMNPMNQPFTRLFVSGMEVGAAYDTAVNCILEHPILRDWKYMLTVEEDNLPPPDGLLKLYESIDEYAGVGSLYWTKGEGGQPMAYGQPGQIPEYGPWLPPSDTVAQVNGIGMGFSLFRLDIFKELERPYFETVQKWDPQTGGKTGTQDLHFCGRIRERGHKVACDTRVKVGHLEQDTGIVW
jgi:hypothetical protein